MSGLGLTYVRSGVARLGGQIEVARRKPRGTVFSIFWPMKLPPMADQPDRTQLAFLHRHKANTVGPKGLGADVDAGTAHSSSDGAASDGPQSPDARKRPQTPQKDNKYLVSARCDESVLEATNRKMAELEIGPSAKLSPSSAATNHLNPGATRPVHSRSDTDRSSSSSSAPVPQSNASPSTNGSSPVHSVQIVEDDPINAKILQKTFVKAGFNVTWAENGQIGFDKWVHRMCLVALLDPS